MAIVIALGIALAAVAFVAAPFFGGRQAARTAVGEATASVELEDLLAEKGRSTPPSRGSTSTSSRASCRWRTTSACASVTKSEPRSCSRPSTACGPPPSRSDAPRRPHREKRRG
ncbi:MAG: hypothetical protein MZW92_38610 [Comamonadaceae bacterium]|nr:hypothetical protein [Comamonadaceae bacterium]